MIPPAQQDTASVLIVEDDTTMCDRLANIVQESASLRLQRCCYDLESGAQAISDLQPDILLVDIGLPDGNGLDLIQFISENKLATRAIVITVFEDNRNIMRAITAGASGYILKDDDSISISDAIHMILNGGAPISPTIARHILNQFAPHDSSTDQEHLAEAQKLTTREKEVLLLVSDGFTDKEIAAQKNISYNTVTTHIKHIYRKLCVRSRVEATRKALSIGLVEAESTK